MSKSSKLTGFIKKNAYYFVFIFCLALLAVITVALVVSGNQNSLETGGNGSQIEDENKQPSGDENQPSDDTNGGDQSGDQNGDQSGDQNQGGEDDKPTASVIVFDMPVNGTVIKDYVGASVIYNQTLGLYSGHKAIDFAAEEGTQVFCVYDGVIESVEISKVNGTSVTVDHGNGLKSVYNSIEADETLLEGMNVSKGDLLGTVSTNNKTEYLDGAHLHFEVLENGAKVDPNKYLTIDGK